MNLVHYQKQLECHQHILNKFYVSLDYIYSATSIREKP